MKKIMVLGSGCKKCHQTQELIIAALKENGSNVSVELETNPAVTMQYQVMRTPAVVIDNELVHCGSVPSQAEIAKWLKSLAT